jgi:hypothetical protein
MLLVAVVKVLSHVLLKLVDQNSALKKEAGIAERKLLARNERIQNLESLLQDADRRLALQNQKFETQLQAVKDRLDQARGRVYSTSLILLFVDLNFLQRKKARFLLHSASRAELRNHCVAAVVALCLVLRQRQLLLPLPLPLPTHLLGSKMRKGTLYVGSFVILI